MITKETTLSPAPPEIPTLEGPSSHIFVDMNPIIPPINAYGTFDPSRLASTSRASSSSALRPLLRKGSNSSDLSSVSGQSQHQPLLPSAQPPQDNVMDNVAGDLIPFGGAISAIRRRFGRGSTAQQAPAPPGEVVRLSDNYSHLMGINLSRLTCSTKRSKGMVLVRAIGSGLVRCILACT
jgi:putative membrane protein